MPFNRLKETKKILEFCEWLDFTTAFVDITQSHVTVEELKDKFKPGQKQFWTVMNMLGGLFSHGMGLALEE